MYEPAKAMRAAREQRGRTRSWLSQKSGVSVNSLYYYETGKNLPSLYNLIALADALKISIDEYIGRKV